MTIIKTIRRQLAGLATLAALTLSYSLAAFSQPAAGWMAYFGNLHSHSAASDGVETPATAYDWALREGKLNFLCLSEHNHLSTQSGLTDVFETSKKATSKNFVALMGQEYSVIERGNHINIYDASDQIPKTLNSNYKALFQEWLPEYKRNNPDRLVVAQFNHPKNVQKDYGIASITAGDTTFENYGGDWEAFRADADHWVRLIAILSGPADSNFPKNQTPPRDEHKDTEPKSVRIWHTYLDKGFHLSPAADQDNHRKSWGTRTKARTGVWINGPITKASLLTALRDNRTFASEDQNLRVWFTINGQPMGSRIDDTGDVDLDIKVHVADDDEPGSKYLIELYHDEIGDGEMPIVAAKSEQAVKNGETWSADLEHPKGRRELYFAHVTQVGSGDHIDDSWTAPIWIEPTPAVSDDTGDDGAVVTGSVKFVSSKSSRVYHLPECRIAREIAERGNLVEHADAPAGKRLHRNCPQ